MTTQIAKREMGEAVDDARTEYIRAQRRGE